MNLIIKKSLQQNYFWFLKNQIKIFQNPESRIRIPDSGFQILESRFRIPDPDIFAKVNVPRDSHKSDPAVILNDI
jgi:hypothetical protein